LTPDKRTELNRQVDEMIIQQGEKLGQTGKQGSLHEPLRL